MAMLEHGASIRQVQAATGLSDKTIAKCRRGEYMVPESMLCALREAEAAKLTLARHAILDSLTDPEQLAEVLAKSTLVQRATAIGILFDKEQLMAGRPTQIESRLRSMSDEELRAEIKRNLRDLGMEVIDTLAEEAVVEEST